MKVSFIVLATTICISFFLFSSALGKKFDYSGEPVIIANVENVHQLKALEYYQEASLRTASEENGFAGALDVWTRGSNLGLGRNDIHLRKPTVQESLIYIRKLNITFEYMYENVQDAIDDPANLHSPTPNTVGAPEWFNSYHTAESIVNYAKQLCGQRNDMCRFNEQIATSINGRAIVALHLYGGDGVPKKQVWINAGQHAREWIAPASLMYILHNLINLYGTNATVTSLINNVEFIIVPMVNPDGYDWAWTNERLWRKNRRNNGAGYGLGVDLNRNWDDHWGKGGSSTNPNSDTYMGKSAFSEPESKGVADYFLKNRRNGFVGFAIDYHSYSQLVLYPYGWTSSPPPNIAQLRTAAAGMVNAIKTTPGGVVYTAQSSYDLYITTGTATDWFHSPQGGNVAISFTLEGRDTGRYGFVLPASLIVQSGEENWAAFYWLCLHTVA